MVKKSSAKQRYLELEKVRVSYDHKLDKIHLTAKDPDMPEGFHLTLNSGRDAEQSLRRILAEYGLIRVAENSAVNNSATGPNVFHYGNSSDEALVWDLNKFNTVRIMGGAGRGAMLNNFVEHLHKHEDAWELHAINLRNQVLRKQVEEYPNLISGHAKTIEHALATIGNFALLVRSRRLLVEEHDVETYQDLQLGGKTPLLLIDDVNALISSEIKLNESIAYENQLRKKIDEILQYIFDNAKIAGIKIVVANRENNENTFDNTLFLHYYYRFNIKIDLGKVRHYQDFEDKYGIPVLGQVSVQGNNVKPITEFL
ncbi:MAG: hypothetical protein H9W81_02495 [Enterococcus sp.]|nr:hypothetical protein [Enterococcus sp.]